MDAGFFLIFLVILIGGIAYSIHESGRLNITWASAAQKLGLAYDAGSFYKDRRISGNLDGCHVIVETFTRGSGKSSRKCTRYRLAFPQPIPFEFTLRKQGILGGLSKAFGAQDIEVGDMPFDKLLMVKSRNPDAMTRFLTSERRDKIRCAIVEFDELEIHQSGMESEYTGQESSEHILIRKITRMVDFARFISAGYRTEKPVAEKFPTLREATSTRVRKARPPSSATPPPPPAPSEPAPPPDPEPAPPQVSQPPHGESAREILNASQLGDALFADPTAITEIAASFDERYSGSEIQGNGTLRSWRPSSFDFVFGPGKYIKATVEIPIPHATTHGRKSFQAVIQLPPETPCPSLGADFSFRGELLKIDPLMRTVFVRGL